MSISPLNTEIIDYLNSLPLAKSLWNIPCIMLIYLLFVLKIGPAIMHNRSPVKSIKKYIPAYNVFQIIINFYLIIWAISDLKFVEISLNNLCGNINPDVEYTKRFIFLGYLWCMIKISDFLDTLFFILLKKTSHVSFLHVYHHASTMMVAFVVFRFIKTEQSLLYAAVNSVVHVVMYTYYLLTSLGYKPRWKKMVTILQLLQFFSLMLMTILLTICQKKPEYFYYSVYGIFQCLMYIYLFGKFYYKSYRNCKIN